MIAVATAATTATAAVRTSGPAFRKCCNPWDWQVAPADLVLWQQLCAGWCAATASSICGQERQFPQNSATTTSAAINELETLRIVILFYTN